MITVLKSKLHFVRVTDVTPDYEGSVGIDSGWMEWIHLRPYEQIHVFNAGNGSRIITYAIPMPHGSQKIQINGAASHHFSVGDKIIIVAFQLIDPTHHSQFQTHKLIFDASNHIIHKESETHI